MNRILEVCLIGLALAVNVTLAASAQSPELQRGISVELAATSNASPMPEADMNDAWIVAVTADGSLYFGVDPVDTEGLTNDMTTHPREHTAKLYIKADARAPFAKVEKVLEIGRTVGFESAVLLTSQAEPPAQGGIVSPKGLEVLVGPPLPAGTVATVVQVLSSDQQSPSLRINGDQIPWPALQSTLKRHFQKGDQRLVLLKADEQLRFADIVQVIDACQSLGAKVVLPTPQL
jgi:biopolymer transport protein ExbD